jgi:hypothetical protein
MSELIDGDFAVTKQELNDLVSMCDEARGERELQGNNLYELPQATLESVPKVLRAIADEIERGDHGRVEMSALVIKNSDGEVNAFGAGGADFYRAITLFHMGINFLMNGGNDA